MKLSSTAILALAISSITATAYAENPKPGVHSGERQRKKCPS
jgi:hypothetical protein